jgi:putative ABC transport system permease protein
LLAVNIALFGIANTLGLSTYERVREIGLLRAVGMARGQVKAMIRIEAITISVFGAILGMSVGVLFGVAIQRAARTSGVTDLVIPVGSLIFYLIISAILGVIAAIFPARRAARLDILHAITYE